MTAAMEIAYAQIQRPEKGEDAYLVRTLDEDGSVVLLAVADGLSLNDGKAAAQWAIGYLGEAAIADNPHVIFSDLRRELASRRLTEQSESSESTLTCGIVRRIAEGEEEYLRFDYFAIGDSPVWKVIVGDSDSKYQYQRIAVHGPPYPAETARVYATIRLHMGDIRGAVTFGSIEVAAGEVLVVCTDGVPEREIFVRDFNSSVAAKSGLCRWLFQKLAYDNKSLGQVLSSYEERGVLFDDTTLIAARLSPVRSLLDLVEVERSEIVPDEPTIYASSPDGTEGQADRPEAASVSVGESTVLEGGDRGSLVENVRVPLEVRERIELSCENDKPDADRQNETQSRDSTSQKTRVSLTGKKSVKRGRRK